MIYSSPSYSMGDDLSIAIPPEDQVDPAKAKAELAAMKSSLKKWLSFRKKSNDVAEGKIKLDELAADKLPEALQGMPPAEREAFLAKKSAERSDLQAKIRDLSQKRQKHIEAKMKESGLQREGSLDHAIYTCIKAQAAKKGINYTGGPAL